MNDAQARTVKRIAMWSGPRNISTALMRSFGNRPDTVVCDEPLYAYYLKQTGYDHPIADQIIARHENDWRKVAAWLTGPLPDGKRIFYQKQMAQHLLPEVGRDWLDHLDHAFLIRDPLRVVVSYIEIMGRATLEELGLPQQVEIFERVVQRTGRIPPVVDSQDLQAQPRAVLEQLCKRLDIDFTARMLHWPPGPRSTDGVWGPYWYAKTYDSTWFRPNRPAPPPQRLPAEVIDLVEQARPYYQHLWRHRIVP